MTSDPQALSAEADASALRQTCRLEVIPLPGVADLVRASVRPPACLTVTCSPRHGVANTLDAAASLVGLGFRVVPHLAARMVRDRSDLRTIVARLRELGIDDVFLVGGDASHPVGRYSSAAQLIEDLVDEAEGSLRIGIAGYPEGHPWISHETLDDALARKAEGASYMVTQMCFDMPLLIEWLRDLRIRDIGLPVFVGVPGVVRRSKLVEISARIGVGESLRYVRKNRRAVLSLLIGSAYRPDGLVRQLANEYDASLGIAGIHFFTFNQVAETQAWLNRQDGSSLPRIA